VEVEQGAKPSPLGPAKRSAPVVPAEPAAARSRWAEWTGQPVAAVQRDASRQPQLAPFDRAQPPAAFSARQSMGPGHEQHPPISDQSVAAQLEDQGSELEAAYWRGAKLFRRFPQGRLKLRKGHLIPLQA